MVPRFGGVGIIIIAVPAAKLQKGLLNIPI